jgi:glycolate oxidase
MEIMDRLAIRASEAAVHAGYPNAAALLIVELEGEALEVQAEAEVLERIRALERRSGLRIGNVFHAGDGNLHPLICYDENIAGQADLAAEVAGEILTYCVEAGGSITGEHGVGADKRDYMPRMFSDVDLDVMQAVRDAIDPRRLCNPGKVLPTPRLCGEVPGPYREHPLERAGLAERF